MPSHEMNCCLKSFRLLLHFVCRYISFVPTFRLLCYPKFSSVYVPLASVYHLGLQALLQFCTL